MSNKKTLTELFLQFLKKDIIPLSILPEIALFLTNRKEFLRLTIQEDKFSEVSAQFQIHQLTFSFKKIYSIYKGNTWYDIKFEKQITDSDKTNIHDIRYLVCCTLGNNDPDTVLVAEENGRIDVAGALLGYPKCCIDAIDELNNSGQKWPLLLLKRTNGPTAGYVNRLASVWGGTTFTGELFPCSLNCKNAIEMGKNAESALWELGLNRLAREIQYFSQRPVLVNRNNGDIKLLDETTIKDLDQNLYLPVFFK